MKRLIGSLMLILILAGCGDDGLSQYDAKNITGKEFLYAVERFNNQSVGIILDRQGEMYYIGAKIDEYNEDTLTGKLTSERNPDISEKTLKAIIDPRDLFTSQFIKDPDDGKIIGLYLFSTLSTPPLQPLQQ